MNNRNEITHWIYYLTLINRLVIQSLQTKYEYWGEEGDAHASGDSCAGTYLTWNQNEQEKKKKR